MTSSQFTSAFFLEDFKNRLNLVLKSEQPVTNQMTEYLLIRPGKFLRPQLVFLSAALYPHDENCVLDMACAVELIHMASLVHDDIVDDALLRRGGSSVKASFGNSAGVLLGDYLFATAFHLIARHEKLQVLRAVTEAIRVMCSGEIQQMASLYQTEPELTSYFSRIFAKTGCLFGASCLVGGNCSDMPRDEQMELYAFGAAMGVAYQIIDDLLDFIGDPTVMGKPVGSDWRQGNLTLPYFYLQARGEAEPAWSLLTDEAVPPEVKREKLVSLMEVSGCSDFCLETAAFFSDEGLEHLKRLPDGEEKENLQHFGVQLWQSYYEPYRMNERTGYGYSLPT